MTPPLLGRRTVQHRKIACAAVPVSVYRSLYAGDTHSFLYESLENDGSRGRYSFLGGRPHAVFTSRGLSCEVALEGRKVRMTGPPLEILRGLVADARMDASVRPFSGGAVGFVSYDAVRLFEKLPDRHAGEGSEAPDLHFLFPEEFVVFDHVDGTVDLIVHSDRPAERRMDELAEACRSAPGAAGGPGLTRSEAAARTGGPAGTVRPPPPDFPGVGGPSARPGDFGAGFRAMTTRRAFEEAVLKAKQYILAGDVFQVVLSQRFSFPVPVPALSVYEALRLSNPSPYMYFLKFDDMHLAGSSPEVLVKVLDGTVTIRPLAGTRPRGRDAAEDASFEAELARDEKERAEHVMLVDLARNDIGRVCEAGSVKPTELFTIERYSKVMHLVSSVRGRLRPGFDAFDCFAACFPAGTVSGAPKVRAMEIIDELEPVRRGVYAGAIGYFDFGGNMDMCIAIRTLVLNGASGLLQAGAGIVADSDPGREYEETLNKAHALFHAVEAAAGLE